MSFAEINKHSLVDCNIFENKGYTCSFDDMRFAAVIKPSFPHVFEDVLLNDCAMSLHIDMSYENKDCLFVPKMNILYHRLIESNLEEDNSPISEIIFKIGDDRYFAHFSPNTQKEYIIYIDKATLTCGPIALEMMRKIANRQFETVLKMGACTFILTNEMIDRISDFINTCDYSGLSDCKNLYGIRESFERGTQFNNWKL